MPEPKPKPPPSPALVSTFAERKRDREAREAAGEKPPEIRRPGGFRAGLNAATPVLVITHVRS